MEKVTNKDSAESLKEEGELSDEEETSLNTRDERPRNGSRRGTSASNLRHSRPHSAAASPSANQIKWARYKADNQRFNGNSNYPGSPPGHRPNLVKFLPSLMDLKIRPLINPNFQPPHGGVIMPRPYPQPFEGRNYNGPSKNDVRKPMIVPSPSSRLWENRRLRTSKEEQEKKEDEDDFETLLKKYKDIQGQLADIRKEEESVENNETIAASKRNEGTEESNAVEKVASTVMPGGSSPVIDLCSSSPEKTDSSKVSKVLQDDDDDEELDELELRRIALASAALNMRLAEVEDSSTSESHTAAEKVKPRPRPAVKEKTGSAKSRQTTKPSPRETRSTVTGYRNKTPKVPTKFLRARTPALRTRKPKYPPPRRVPEIHRSDSRTHRPAADLRLRQDRNRSRSGPRVPETEPHDKSKDTSAEKTREIQKILLLDDPEEQVSRFLALVNQDDQDGKKSNSSHQVVKKEAVEQSKDNYEEVEMDIDSDGDTSESINPAEELFEPDYFSAMQPMYTSNQAMYEAYDPAIAWSLPQPSYSTVSRSQLLSHPMPQLPVGPSLSDGLMHPSYLGSEMPYIPGAPFPEFQPPLPPPPPSEPPPAPPPPPPGLPPLPASSPPPLPTEPPPPPPPSEPEDRKPTSVSLEDHIQAVLRSMSKASECTPKLEIFPQVSERLTPVTKELKTNLATLQTCFSASDSDLYIGKRTSEFPAKDDEGSVSLSAKRQRVEKKDIQASSVVHSKVEVCDVKASVITTKLPTASGEAEQQVEKLPTTTDDSTLEEEDEEEEDILRARLLQSLAAKKKEKIKSEAVHQSYSSPNLSRSQSPATLVPGGTRSQSPVTLVPGGTRSPSPITLVSEGTRSQSPIILVPGGTKASKSHKHHYHKIHLGNLPTQKPVVIRLGEDSSDEEGERRMVSPPAVSKYLGGLDSFLKEARKSTERERENKPRSEELRHQEVKRQELLSAKLRYLETDLIKHNEAITRDQGLLKVLVSRASNYLQNVKLSEQKVKQLTEQLAAAEKVGMANRGALEKAKKQARMIKDGLLRKKTDYEAMQRCLLEMGRELHGHEYQIGMAGASVRRVQSTNMPMTTRAQQGKQMPKKYIPKNRQMREIKITINNTANPGATSPAKHKLSNKEIIMEKARLQKLAKEYEKKIQQLKLAKTNRVEIPSPKVSNKVPKVEGSVETDSADGISKSILKLAKIELGTDPIDLTDDSELVKCRRSLMELNPSTRPDLKMRTSSTRRNSEGEKENNIEIKVPEGKVLLKLLKLQKSQVDDQLKQVSQQFQSLCENQEYADLIRKPKQIGKLAAYKGTIQPSPAPTTSSKSFVYSSPLLHFRSYRFSPYFRTKALKQLRSRSIAHKILPKKLFCRFDVQGTCNDDKCKGQHQELYTMADREILLDILAYCPQVAGVQNGMPAKKIAKVMGDHVDTLLKQNQGRLSLDEMCLLLISRVNDKSKHIPPHTMFYTSRPFRPKQVEKLQESHDMNFKDGGNNEFVWKPLGPAFSKAGENVVLEDDRRYFYTDTVCEVQDLESAVMTSPHLTELWLKLASKKRHNPNSPPEKCLDEALNALARGLEKNKGSSPLWLEYLGLYARHKEATDYSDLCQTALHYAPSFDIWWLYLHSLASYTARNEVSSEVIDYLCSLQSVQDSLDPGVSHHLLETMLYKVHLSVMAGQLQYAKNILQGFFVKSEGKRSCQSKLTIEDRSILWLCYIHLMSWQDLPMQLWDPANQLSGKIIHKEKLLLPWHKLSAPDFSADQQMALLEEAIKVCVGDLTADMSVLQDGMVLYKNMILLLQTQNKLEEVLTLCRDLLQRDQSLVDVWLTVANLYAGNGEDQATGQVFKDAVEVNPLSAKMFNFAANFAMAQSDNGAMKLLESCPRGFFVQGERLDDPLSLYCVLLKQALPIGYVVPEFRSDVSEGLLAKQQPYLWLNYCLFLELRKDVATVIEMYETALCALVSVGDVAMIWRGYLEFQYRQSTSHPVVEMECKKFNQLFHRCLLTLPVKLPLPHWPGETIEDYSHVNRLVDLYLNCLFPENRLVTLDRLVHLMPNNVELILRACVDCLKQGDDQRALGFCYPLLYDRTCNRQLWKLAMSLTMRLGTKPQTYKMFYQAVGRMPYELSLWKDFLIYEVTRGGGSKERVQAIIQQCQMLGLNTGELIQLLQQS